jgi:hypothetical protein
MTVAAMPSTSTEPATTSAMIAGRDDGESGAPETTVAEGTLEGGTSGTAGCAGTAISPTTAGGMAGAGGPPKTGGNAVALGGGVSMSSGGGGGARGSGSGGGGGRATIWLSAGDTGRAALGGGAASMLTTGCATTGCTTTGCATTFDGGFRTDGGVEGVGRGGKAR